MTIRIVLGILCLSAVAGAAEADKTQKYQKGFNKGDVETAVMLLNRMEEHPASVSEIYRNAYALLDNNNASFSVLVEDDDFQALCRKYDVKHLGGPMLGSLTDDGICVWVRTCYPTSVSVTVKMGEEEKTFGPVQSTVDSDLAAIVPITGLKPEESYSYSVQVDGTDLPLSDDATIRMPSQKGRKVRIAFGSCYHRSGIGNPMQADLIRERGADALLLLGDIAVQDRNNHLGLHRADYLLRDMQQPWRRLTASVPVYALWDDHDYFNNDQAGIPKRFTATDTENVCDVFTKNWVNPAYGFGDERRGVFMRARVGPCDIITVDHRYFRDRQPGTFLGNEQMAWLKENLLACKGPFIILGCGTMWSDYVSGGKDSWGRYGEGAEREELFSFIEENHIAGVLLVSGDRHGARGFTIPRASGFSFYEFEPGSLGGRSGPSAKSDKWETQLFGIANEYAFGEFSIDASLADPEVIFRLMKDNGEEIYKLHLKRSQLTPAGLKKQ